RLGYVEWARARPSRNQRRIHPVVSQPPLRKSRWQFVCHRRRPRRRSAHEAALGPGFNTRSNRLATPRRGSDGTRPQPSLGTPPTNSRYGSVLYLHGDGADDLPLGRLLPRAKQFPNLSRPRDPEDGLFAVRHGSSIL